MWKKKYRGYCVSRCALLVPILFVVRKVTAVHFFFVCQFPFFCFINELSIFWKNCNSQYRRLIIFDQLLQFEILLMYCIYFYNYIDSSLHIYKFDKSIFVIYKNINKVEVLDIRVFIGGELKTIVWRTYHMRLFLCCVRTPILISTFFREIFLPKVFEMYIKYFFNKKVVWNRIKK